MRTLFFKMASIIPFRSTKHPLGIGLMRIDYLECDICEVSIFVKTQSVVSTLMAIWCMSLIFLGGVGKEGDMVEYIFLFFQWYNK